MDDEYLYRQIAESIRQDILAGRLKPGDRLPSVRELADQRGCTIGTIQHAYHELADQGLIISRAGQGTKVVEKLPAQPGALPLRRLNLFNRAEAFLLEVLTAGYSIDEVESSIHLALDRWRVMQNQASEPVNKLVRFAGSHDIAVNWLASHFPEITEGSTFQVTFAGSLGGMIALAEGRAEIAGSHLWDHETAEYNLPFVRRLLPGKKTALVTLAHRRLGLILPPGNPAHLDSLEALAGSGVRFINRQSGSGTRVWLDVSLHNLGIDSSRIPGYLDERMTHSEVARSVADGRAGAGLGLEASALAFGLDFVMLARERYDLVIPEKVMQLPAIQALLRWLKSQAAKEILESLGGYSADETGSVRWVDD